MPRLGQSITRTEPNRRWTPAEEAALVAGVDKHGSGKWQAITTDPDLAIGGALQRRSNVDLKDKWRNMRFSAGSLKRKAAHRAGVRDQIYALGEQGGPIRPHARRIGNQDPSGGGSGDEMAYHPHAEAGAHMHSAAAAAESLAAMVRQRSLASSAPSFPPESWPPGQQYLQPSLPQQLPPQQLQHSGWMSSAAALPPLQFNPLPGGGAYQQGLPGSAPFNAGTAITDPFAAALAAGGSRAVGQPGMDMSLGLAALQPPPPASTAAALQALQQHQQLQMLDAGNWHGGAHGNPQGGGSPKRLPQQGPPAAWGQQLSPAAAQEGLRQQVYAAAASLDVGAVAERLRYGAAFADTPDPRTGRTPMHAVAACPAVHGGSDVALRAAGGVIALLLQCGARVDAPDAAGVTPLQLAVGSRLAVVLHAASRAPAEMAARLQEVCVHGAPGGVLPLGGGGQLPFGSGAAFDGSGGASGGGFGGGGGGTVGRGAGEFGPAGERFGGPPAGSSPSGARHGALQTGGPSIAEQQVSARAAAAAVKEQSRMGASAAADDRQVIIELQPQAPQGSSILQGGIPKGGSPPAAGSEQSFGVRPHAASQGLGFSMPPSSFGMEPGSFGAGGDRGSPLGLGGLALANKPPAGLQAHGTLPLDGLHDLPAAFSSGHPTLQHTVAAAPPASASNAPQQQAGQDFRSAAVAPPRTKDTNLHGGDINFLPLEASTVPRTADGPAAEPANKNPSSRTPFSDTPPALLPSVQRPSSESERTSLPWLAPVSSGGSGSSGGPRAWVSAAGWPPQQLPAGSPAADPIPGRQ